MCVILDARDKLIRAEKTNNPTTPNPNEPENTKTLREQNNSMHALIIAWNK